MGNVLNCHAVIENNPQRAYFAISNTIARVTICNDTCMSHFLPSLPPLSALHTSLHPSPPSSSSLSVYWTQRWLLSIMLAYSTLCCFRNVQLHLLTNRIMFISGDCYYLWYSSPKCSTQRAQCFVVDSCPENVSHSAQCAIQWCRMKRNSPHFLCYYTSKYEMLQKSISKILGQFKGKKSWNTEMRKLCFILKC